MIQFFISLLEIHCNYDCDDRNEEENKQSKGDDQREEEEEEEEEENELGKIETYKLLEEQGA